jgi:DNA (cytosine-5)-methyltransferase 1
VRAISLFTGAGGLDLGLEKAGWEVLAQIESDADCTATLELRESPGEIIGRPIERVPPSELRKKLGLKRRQLDLLAGGPPCQPFTTSGLRRALSDARAASLFPAYIDYVKEFVPSALLIENVDGMLSAALEHRPLAQRGSGHATLRLDERKGSFLRYSRA